MGVRVENLPEVLAAILWGAVLLAYAGLAYIVLSKLYEVKERLVPGQLQFDPTLVLIVAIAGVAGLAAYVFTLAYKVVRRG